MTATSVNGVAVIADEPARAPFTNREVYFKQIRLLMLEDESTVFGCAHCDYTAAGPGSVRGHLGTHGKPRSRAVAKAASEMSISDLLKRLAELDKLTAERDQWKARAVKAEQDLSAIRGALGVQRR